MTFLATVSAVNCTCHEKKEKRAEVFKKLHHDFILFLKIHDFLLLLTLFFSP